MVQQINNRFMSKDLIRNDLATHSNENQYKEFREIIQET